MVTRSIGRALGLVSLVAYVSGVGPAVAESQPSPSLRADSLPSSPQESLDGGLPSVPKLELSLPPLAPPAAQRAEYPFGPAYWDVMRRLRPWRGAGDGELRLRIETASFEWGGARLSAGVTTIPEHERECAPSCTGPEWSSSVVLRYSAGEVGPLRDLGPELQLGGKLGAGREGSPGSVKAGVGGVF